MRGIHRRPRRCIGARLRPIGRSARCPRPSTTCWRPGTARRPPSCSSRWPRVCSTPRRWRRSQDGSKRIPSRASGQLPRARPGARRALRRARRVRAGVRRGRGRGPQLDRSRRARPRSGRAHAAHPGDDPRPVRRIKRGSTRSNPSCPCSTPRRRPARRSSSRSPADTVDAARYDEGRELVAAALGARAREQSRELSVFAASVTVVFLDHPKAERRRARPVRRHRRRDLLGPAANAVAAHGMIARAFRVRHPQTT